MIRPIITAFVTLVMLGLGSAQAQQSVTFKRFVPFKQIVQDVDFYSSNRQTIAPYEKPVAEAVARLKSLLGTNIPRGAIFVCSTLEQKDAIYEPMVLKQGYGWTLTAITPQVRIQEQMERMKSQMGGDIPAEIKARMQSRLPEMMTDFEKQSAATTAQQVAYAVLQSMLSKDLKFRSSRLDDMGKSPLPDWLDIGIGAYATGANSNLAYLQQHMDQTFPVDDVVSMSRPFVASGSDQGGGGGEGRGGMRFGGANGGGAGGSGQGMPQGVAGGMPQGMTGGMPQGMAGGMPQGMSGGMPQGGFGGRGNNGGGFNGNGGQRGGGGQRVVPKDEQDRMLFDGQASTLFSYLVEKIGVEKVKRLIKETLDGKESRQILTQPDMLGSNWANIEDDWAAWVKALKAPQDQRQGFPGRF